ncbi:aldo/keto reductase [Prolixibacteraceae bacterium Z1-6]|uniref:Aldo/keto reductase n=1 Tax=Draconibacterium aestuarii TaxID=2998507 RepID=A0A9X3F3P3_9BACT|nr:aldo/keto reductase [Prolixibacteraceae bacterium Z1-6]
MAVDRGDTLAQMAINWLLKDNRVTSVLIGASKVAQIKNAVDGLKSQPLSETELG